MTQIRSWSSRAGASCVLVLLLAPELVRAGEAPARVAPAPGASAPSAGPTQAALAGDIPTPGPITREELLALGPLEASWSAHGQTHRVRGVRVDKLLAARGFTPGKMGKDVPKAEKRAGWRKVLLVTAADGYQALLSCAEMFEEMGPTQALLVWEVDGQPLSSEQGPLRLVVTTDREPSRSIFAVRKLELIDLPALVNHQH